MLREEMALLGTVVHEEQGEAELSVWLDTTASADDLIAVSCFVVSEDQGSVQPEALPASAQTAATPAPISEEAVPAAESPAAALLLVLAVLVSGAGSSDTGGFGVAAAWG